MARSKTRRNNSETRDLVSVATTPLVRSPSSLSTSLLEVSDMRAFDFEPATRPAKLFTGVDASIGAETTPQRNRAPSRVPYQIAFSAPAETLVCVRRKRRKQVLFAKRKAGKGGQRKARWNKWSSVKC